MSGPAPGQAGAAARAEPATAWHAHTAQHALAALGADPARGLTAGDARRRGERFGPNQLTLPRRVTFRHIFAEEVTEPMILLLIAVAVLYSVWGSLQDAVTIVVVIAAVVLIEVWTEFRAKAAVAALGELTAPAVPVVRDGQVTDIPAEQLVPGDMILLRPGERIPADARLVGATGLQADESALTGESLPAAKDPGLVLTPGTPLADRANLVYAGTAAVAGSGLAVVTATGMATELGRITGLVREAKPPRTPLQQAMRDLAGRLAWLAIGLSVLVPLLGIAGGQPVRQMILTGLTLAFATVPEELPILVTMVLGLGAWRLSRRQALIRRLRAAETLGEVSVIVTDKTGTLTENQMTITQLWTAGQWRPLRPDLTPAERDLLAHAALCTDAAVVGSGAGLQVRGDPIDAALIRAAGARSLLAAAPGREAWYGIEPGHPLMTAVSRGPDGDRLVVTKGAAEAVLARCAAVPPGVPGQVSAVAANGSRVVAVATRHSSGPGPLPARDDLEKDLTLAGLVAFADPPRPEAAGAIAAVRGAGIRVVMVTGDHPATAAAVARSVGLGTDVPITGAALAGMDGPDLDRQTASADVFARVTPADKLAIVESLQRAGQVVAVTGDGINDAPALARADIGVAMGDGADVAKDAAGMILADGNFATIAAAVAEGRHLSDNLRKGICYYLACKIALVASAAAGVIAGLPVPFAPIQIVVLEAFMDIAASTTFTAEPAEPGVMARPPRPAGARFLDRPFLEAMTAGAAALFAAVAGIYLWAAESGYPAATAQTLAFATWMTGYIALAWVMRSGRLRAGLFSNRVLISWTAVTAAALALFVAVAVLRHALKLASLTPGQWLLAVGVPLVAMAVPGARNSVIRRRARHARPWSR
jgi:Ca2+-transporting ATPase